MLAESVIEDGVAGGECLARRSLYIYMRGIRAAYGVVERKYLVVDDYLLPPCRQAVRDFRERYGVSESDPGHRWRRRVLAKGSATEIQYDLLAAIGEA